MTPAQIALITVAMAEEEGVPMDSIVAFGMFGFLAAMFIFVVYMMWSASN